MARPGGISFIPSTWETEAERSICEFKTSQYNETLRTARNTLGKSLNTKMKQKDVFSHYTKHSYILTQQPSSIFTIQLSPTGTAFFDIEKD